MEKDDLPKAVAQFQEAIRLKKDFAGARRNLDRAQRMARAADRLPAYLQKKYQPGDVTERVALAQLCAYCKHLYAAAAGLYAEALAIEPRLGEQPNEDHYYDAACAAAAAGCGRGKDAGTLDLQARRPTAPTGRRLAAVRSSLIPKGTGEMQRQGKAGHCEPVAQLAHE